MVYVHNGILLRHKKRTKILTFAARWMDLEGIMLSETSQRQRQMLYDITYMWNLKDTTN